MTLENSILLYGRHSNKDFGHDLSTWPLWRRVRFLRSSGRHEGVERIDDVDIRTAYFAIMDASDDDITTALNNLGTNYPER